MVPLVQVAVPALTTGRSMVIAVAALMVNVAPDRTVVVPRPFICWPDQVSELLTAMSPLPASRALKVKSVNDEFELIVSVPPEVVLTLTALRAVTLLTVPDVPGPEKLMVPAPVGMTTSFVAFGTEPVLQLPAVVQLESTPPSHFAIDDAVAPSVTLALVYVGVRAAAGLEGSV